MGVEFFIGGRYLHSKQKYSFLSLITFLSVAGVTVGVMALIVVIAVMAGFKNEVKSEIVNIDAHITLKRDNSFTDYRQVANSVGKIKGVESATPFLTTWSLLSVSDENPVIIRGADLPTVKQGVKYLDPEPLIENDENRMADQNISPGIMLGEELAIHLGVSKGDSVQLISARKSSTPIGIGIIPITRKFQVVGLFKSGLYEYDRNLAYISLGSAQSLLGKKDVVSSIDIRVTDVTQADHIRREIIESLGGYPYKATDWMQNSSTQSYFKALELQKTVMFIVLALIILVASFNIASTLIMMVMNKRKDIAILRTMGASDKQIRRIFAYKGMVIGMIGTLLGGCLGVILCILLKRYKFIELDTRVYLLDRLPVDMQVMDIVAISLTALVICFIATIYPARKASTLNPVEAIRNE